MVMLKLTQEFKEFLNLLESGKIEYLVIGGYAVGLYGHVRPTKDIDLWVSIEPENIDRIQAALIQFGFPPSSVALPLFSDQTTMLRIGFPPNRIELISKIAGVEFKDCYPQMQRLMLDDVFVPVISLDDLRKNKLATGRPQDAGDVQKLDARRRLESNVEP